MLDTRRPALVTEGLHARLSHELAPLDFVARKKAFVRKRGKITHRIEMSSSHHNAPGFVAAWIALTYVDTAVARVESGWRAGGELGGAEFLAEPPVNVADPAQVEVLVARIHARLGFFAQVDDAPALLERARRGYVPGMLEPRVLVPYLVARMGNAAASSYASALLGGRPELWPAFLGASAETVKAQKGTCPDHGTDLSLSLAKLEVRLETAPPRDAVVSSSLGAANLRCFFGRQLRAWGEPEAAAWLRRIPDPRIQELRAAQEAMRGPDTGPPVDDGRQVAIVLHEVTGDTRAPRRERPTPRFFQYHVLQEPWA